MTERLILLVRSKLTTATSAFACAIAIWLLPLALLLHCCYCYCLKLAVSVKYRACAATVFLQAWWVAACSIELSHRTCSTSQTRLHEIPVLLCCLYYTSSPVDPMHDDRALIATRLIISDMHPDRSCDIWCLLACLMAMTCPKINVDHPGLPMGAWVGRTTSCRRVMYMYPFAALLSTWMHPHGPSM